MKKIFGFIIALLCLTTGISSCMGDANAEATCTYVVWADSTIYSDTLDVQYDSIVQLSLQTLGHAYYSFSESAKVDQSLTAIAIAKCDEQATARFKANLAKNVTLEDIKKELYKANSDFFAEQGITHASDIPLSPFTLYLSLQNFANGVYIEKGTIVIR